MIQIRGILVEALGSPWLSLRFVDGLFSFSVLAGGLPWKTYQKLGFRDETFETNDDLPEWAKGGAPSDVMREVEAALAAGRPKRELHSKLMVLRLKGA